MVEIDEYFKCRRCSKYFLQKDMAKVKRKQNFIEALRQLEESYDLFCKTCIDKGKKTNP